MGRMRLLPLAASLGMLVTHDSGLFGGLWEAIPRKGAHSLCAGKPVLTHRAYTLKDGSYVAWLSSKDAVYPRPQKSMLIHGQYLGGSEAAGGRPGRSVPTGDDVARNAHGPRWT